MSDVPVDPAQGPVPATPDANGGPSESAPRWTSVEYNADRKVFRGLVFKEMLLIALTLGIYWFWARTRVRRFLWANTTINGTSLEYSGRGIELFIGFIIAGIIVGLIYWLIQIGTATLLEPGMAVIVGSFIFVPFFLFLSALATYRARRYMVLRTAWRGIRCGLSGSTLGFVAKMIPLTLLTIITLGLAYPWLAVAVQRYLVSNMSLGSAKFRYEGKGKDLFGAWFLVLLLYIPTFGLSLMWWIGRVAKFHYNAVRLEGLKLESDIRPGHVVATYFLGSILVSIFLYPPLIAGGLMIGSVEGLVEGILAGSVITIFLGVLAFSLFFAASWALTMYFITYRITEHYLTTLVITGSMDWSKIEQAHPELKGPGDGLDAVLSMDGI